MLCYEFICQIRSLIVRGAVSEFGQPAQTFGLSSEWLGASYPSCAVRATPVQMWECWLLATGAVAELPNRQLRAGECKGEIK